MREVCASLRPMVSTFGYSTQCAIPGNQWQNRDHGRAFCRTMVGNICLPQTSPVPQVWVRHFVILAFLAQRDLRSITDDSWTTERNTSESTANSSTPGLDSIIRALRESGVFERQGMEGDAYRFEMSIHRISFFRRVFMTERGYFGLALDSVDVNDEAALFLAARAPFIIPMSHTSETFEFLGIVYVHGAARK